MKNKYKDLIEQTFEFPNEEFSVVENDLEWVSLSIHVVRFGYVMRIGYCAKGNVSMSVTRKAGNRMPRLITPFHNGIKCMACWGSQKQTGKAFCRVLSGIAGYEFRASALDSRR